MSPDFTHLEYRRLLDALKASGYRFHTFAEYHYAGGQLSGRHVLLRHDVDRMPARAAAMARLEVDQGVRATYFFRSRGSSFNPGVIEAVGKLGHEIGYHYECLADTGGDPDAAWALFQRELGRFSAFGPITSIAMHGRPLSRWDSRDLWSRFDYRNAGVGVEAYLDIDWTRYIYLSDTGRRWDGAYNVRDVPPGVANNSQWAVRSTKELRESIARACPDLVLSVHPERWAASLPGWIQAWLLDSAANTVKLLLRRTAGPRHESSRP